MKRPRTDRERLAPLLNKSKPQSIGDEKECSVDLEPTVTAYPINRDCQEYRARYPRLSDSSKKLDKNWRFYNNELKSSPRPGGTIEEILARWAGDYDLLERHHGYIQWLFPIRVQGMNDEVHPLQLHEAQAIRNCRVTRMRVLSAYRMMLDFYGLQLVDERSGQLMKLPEFETRLTHLVEHPHNLLRITRIIRSLGELGWQRLQRPLVQLYLDVLLSAYGNSASTNNPMATVGMRQLARSCLSYWVNSVLDERDWHQLKAQAGPLLLPALGQRR